MSTSWSSRVEELDMQWIMRKSKYKHFRKDNCLKIVELYKPSEKILDVGCGTGILYRHLPKNIKKHYLGIDFTKDFIDLCKKRYPQGKWLVGDATKLNLPDDSFYIVNTANVLQHIEDWEKAAKELVRVSKKYVINIERIHNRRTKIITRRPCVRRRFNPTDIVEFYRHYGSVSWIPVKSASGFDLLGLFLTKLKPALLKGGQT